MRPTVACWEPAAAAAPPARRPRGGRSGPSPPCAAARRCSWTPRGQRLAVAHLRGARLRVARRHADDVARLVAGWPPPVHCPTTCLPASSSRVRRLPEPPWHRSPSPRATSRSRLKRELLFDAEMVGDELGRRPHPASRDLHRTTYWLATPAKLAEKYEEL